MNSKDKQLITKMIKEKRINLTDMVDLIIELNCLVGVGLVSFSENLAEYVLGKIN